MKATCFALLVILLLLGISCDALSPFRRYKETGCCSQLFHAKRIKLQNINSYRKTRSSCNQQAYIVDIKGIGDRCYKIQESLTKIMQKFDEQQKNGTN
ncbi:hypothetical protein XELAEV_18015358mg [Xenopus laevis]|uniref:Chemokine interleukin-8-like domain-containing protein n=1 Tax=Xenopus laevis TaxID=8355 RepID=A0A974DHV5_XENLA|nr:hypothetical protein XELAEV_18015358mg [Xenopus laevis]